LNVSHNVYSVHSSKSIHYDFKDTISIGFTILINVHLSIILYIYFFFYVSHLLATHYKYDSHHGWLLMVVFKHFRNATNLSFLMYQYVISYLTNTVFIIIKTYTILVSMSLQITFCYINENEVIPCHFKNCEYLIFIGNNNSYFISTH